MEIQLNDGKKMIVESGKTGKEVAQQISLSLAKKAVAFTLNNVLHDLRDPVMEEGQFSLILAGDKASYDVLNHSASHLLAQAIHHLYPAALFGFGPSIEEGFYYDIDFQSDVLTENDFAKIEKEMMRIVAQGETIERRHVSKAEAKQLFQDNPYKLELIDGIEGEITVYQQGDFIDLCAGPHLEKVSQVKHVKLLSLAGAYWRGDSKNPQLTRIYGTAFFSKEDLEQHLLILEERKKRDHRRIGKDLDLFMISDYGPGFPFWLPNGYCVRRLLEDYWLDLHQRNGYVIIQTPIMLSKELWETSGHWANYKNNMYTTSIDEKEFAIKPMNCPGGILAYKHDMHSYRDLPLRIGELGQVHRHEASGALAGLFRVRTFTQDDAHIFMREDQIQAEVGALLKLYDTIYSVFGLSYHIELSTRPEEKYIGDIAIWDKAERILAESCKASGREFKVNPGDGAFYGPKLDFKLKDSMGRIWQCGTIQLDMNLPERFDLSYIDSDGNKARPVMLHRAIYGSIERFLGILTEHFAGAFPLWLAPIQIVVLPVATEAHAAYAKEIEHLALLHGLRVQIDTRQEKLGYRLRDAQMKKVPYTLVIGDEEVASRTITYRCFGHQEQIRLELDAFFSLLETEIATKALRK